MYLFAQQTDSGKALIESILPRARGMPFYQLVNDPLKVIVGLADVKQKVRMADFEVARPLHSGTPDLTRSRTSDPVKSQVRLQLDIWCPPAPGLIRPGGVFANLPTGRIF